MLAEESAVAARSGEGDPPPPWPAARRRLGLAWVGLV
jgi:hypothetical protein